MASVFKIVDRRLLITLLLVMSVVTGLPASRVMASEGDPESSEKPSQQAALRPVAESTPDIPFTEFDPEAELMLLQLANQSRAQAGAPALTLDAGLSKAARAHAEAMFAARQLSHQFDGEFPLPQRLGNATQLPLEEEGENVALDFDAAHGHQHLMLSPPHRANLLNPDYNVVGMAVVRSGDRLYIVQDFGRALPNYSAAEVKERIAATVAQARRGARQGSLDRRDLPTADDAACSMAHADKLNTAPVHQLAQRYTVLSYTSLHPESLPANAGPVLSSRNLRSFSVGTCYAHTPTYPTGVYWVVLSLD